MLYKFYGSPSAPETLRLLKYICEDGTIRASDPRTFNDPFEFKVVFDFDASEDVIRDRYFADNPDATDADYVAWKVGFTPQFERAYRHDARTRILSSFGVLCLTSSDENQLLWSHYATAHQGFCIGFDDSIIQHIPGIYQSGTVQYQRAAPVFRYYLDPPDIFEKAVFSISPTAGNTKQSTGSQQTDREY